MLVISRKNSERIHIGDNVVVTVLKTRRGGVQIGIDAPRDVSVRRAELVQVPVLQSTAGEQPAPASTQASSTLEHGEAVSNPLNERLLQLSREHRDLVVRELRPGQLWFAGTIS